MLELVLAVGLTAAALFLLARYAQYGQKEAASRSAGARVSRSDRQSAEEECASEGQDGDISGRGRPAGDSGNTGPEGQSEVALEKTQLDGDFAGEDLIRVRIMDQDFQHEYHAAVSVSCKNAYTVTKPGGSSGEEGGKEADADGIGTPEKQDTSEAEQNGTGGSAWTGTYSAGEMLQIEAGELQEQEILKIEGADGAALSLESLERGDGVPQYGGALYLIGGADGISVINELPLEEYVCSVVSSEMPSDYPKEAQKAQAVCARTYAENCRARARSGAIYRSLEEEVGNTDGELNSAAGGNTGVAYEDLNDSVSFQVYNNYRSTELSRAAAAETAGETLPLQEVQYYSTSCLSEHREDLGSDAAFAAFLAQKPESGAQYGSPWLRWRTAVPEQAVLEKLGELYGADETQPDPASADEASESFGGEQETQDGYDGEKTPEDVPERMEITVDERRGDGQVQAVTIAYGGNTFRIEGEYQIRNVLGDRQTELELMDGSTVSGMQLLPSAFFCLKQTGEGICIEGGGYGHGNGMSQCGAAEMAALGLDYRAILEYYYGVAVVQE